MQHHVLWRWWRVRFTLPSTLFDVWKSVKAGCSPRVNLVSLLIRFIQNFQFCCLSKVDRGISQNEWTRSTTNSASEMRRFLQASLGSSEQLARPPSANWSKNIRSTANMESLVRQTFGRSRGLEISPAISRWSQAISRRSRGLEISRGSQAISSSRDQLKHNSRTEGIHFSEDEHSLHTDRMLHYGSFDSQLNHFPKFSTCMSAWTN